MLYHNHLKNQEPTALLSAQGLLTYKLVIAYDGTAYSGWQTQHNAFCIQALIEKALSTLLGCPTGIVGSGRTDAGVHALGQVAHFRTSSVLSCRKILFSLNALLPTDVRILSLTSAAPSFHARFSALSKRYHYYLNLNDVTSPFQKLYVYHPPHPVNIDTLKNAAKYFVGTHDFTSFANVGSSKGQRGNVRTIYRLDVIENGHEVCLCFEGNGFLYKMVRNIVGTLLEISANRLSIEDISHLFAAKDRRKVGVAAPARGLFLMQVTYEKEEAAFCSASTEMASKESK